MSKTPVSNAAILLSLAAALFIKLTCLAWETTGFISLAVSYSFIEHCANALLTASYDIPFICLCCLIITAVPKRYCPLAAALISLIAGLTAFTDILHMRYYTMPFSIAELRLVKQLPHVADAVFALVHPADIILFADMPYWAVIVWAGCRASHKAYKCTASAALICLLLMYWNYSATRDMYNIQFDARSELRIAGAAVYHIHDILYSMSLQRVDDPATSQSTAEYIAQYRKGIAQPDLYGAARGKNLIVLQVESLQSLAIGAVSRSTDITPNLNRLAAEGMYFPNVYCQTVMGGTSDAEFMIHTGLYPANSGVVFTNNDNREYQSLPKELARAGYDIAVFHADSEYYWGRNTMYPRLGITKNYADKDYELTEIIGLGLSDKEFLKQSVAKIKNMRRPYYAFLITLTSHTPFGNYDKEVDNGYPKVDNPTMADRYFSDMKYVDTQIGMFIKELEAAGMMENTVLLITGDHVLSPHIEDQRPVAKDCNSSPASLMRGAGLPVIIHGVGAATTNNMQARQIDIMPTLAGLFGIDMSSFKYASGVSLLCNDVIERPVLARGRKGYIIVNSRDIVMRDNIFRASGDTIIQMPLSTDIYTAELADFLNKTIYPRD